MKLEKGILIKSVLFMLTLLLFLPGIQGIKEESTSYSGVIKSIDKDLKFIVVDDQKILISENTKIMDEKGNLLLSKDLKTGLSVLIEGGPRPDGFLARKIVIKSIKKKP